MGGLPPRSSPSLTPREEEATIFFFNFQERRRWQSLQSSFFVGGEGGDIYHLPQRSALSLSLLWRRHPLLLHEVPSKSWYQIVASTLFFTELRAEYLNACFTIPFDRSKPLSALGTALYSLLIQRSDTRSWGPDLFSRPFPRRRYVIFQERGDSRGGRRREEG